MGIFLNPPICSLLETAWWKPRPERIVGPSSGRLVELLGREVTPPPEPFERGVAPSGVLPVLVFGQSRSIKGWPG